MTAPEPPRGSARPGERKAQGSKGVAARAFENLAGLACGISCAPAAVIHAGIEPARLIASFGNETGESFSNQTIIPICDEVGRVLGTLTLLDKSVTAISESQSGLLSGLAGQAAALMELGGEATHRAAPIEAQFRDILELIPDAVLIHSKGKLTFVNSAMVKLSGLKPADLVGRPASILFAPETRESVEGRIEESYQTNLPSPRKTLRFRRYDGKDIPLEMASMAILLEGEDCRLVVARDVSPRMEAAENLRESEERFQTFMDHSPLMAFIKDERNRFLYVNRSMGETFKAKVGGADPVHQKDPESRSAISKTDRAVIEGQNLEYVEKAPTPDGVMRTWWVSKFPFQGKGGQRLIGGISLDITEREKAEARIRVFADIFRNIQAGLFVWQLEGPMEKACFRLLATNAAAARMTGLSIDDVIGKTMQEAFPGIYELGLTAKCLQVIATGESMDLGEVPYGGKSSPAGHYSAKIIPLPNDNVAVAFENVTEERRNREVLRQSVERFELIARATNDAVWEYTPATGETWWNDRAYQLFGYAPGGPASILKAWNDRLHPEDRECVLESFRDHSGGSAETWVREYRILRGDGVTGHIYERGYVVRDEAGTPMRMLGAMLDITELKRAEDAMRESEEKYRKLVEVSPDIIAIVVDGRISFINQAGLQFHGVDDSRDVVGRPVMDFFHPDSRNAVLERLRQLDDGKEIPSMEHKFLRKDGTSIEAESRAISFPYQGHMAKLAVIRDITARKQAESALRTSEERYRTLAAVSPVGLYRTDLEGRCTYINDHLCGILGMSQQEMVGRFATFSVHPDDMEWVVDTWQTAASQNLPFHAEYRLLRADKRIVWVMGNALSDKAPDGSRIGYVGTISDITERKQAEILLACQKRTLALVASGWHIQDVLDSLVRYAEKESACGTGCVLQLDAETKRLSWFSAPDLGDSFRSQAPTFPQGPAGGALGVSVTSKEFACTPDIASDPEWNEGRDEAVANGFAACASRPILGSFGQVLGVFAFFYPATGDPPAYDIKLLETASDLAAIAIERQKQQEISRKNQELSEQNLRIQEASRMKSEFLANMSHELRTPLNAIIGFSQLLIDHKVGHLNEKQSEYLGDILDGGMHLLRLINDVLDLAKIEAGKMQLFREEINLPQAMREVCAILLPMALGKGVKVLTSADPEAETAYLDGGKVRQVLYNLVSNAIKFSHPSGKVTVVARRDDQGGIRLLVIDNGIGIRKEDLGKLFRQFQQLDSGSARHYPGSGLGLVITKKLVELHRGTVEVRSEPGLGSTFTALFPRHEPLHESGSEEPHEGGG